MQEILGKGTLVHKDTGLEHPEVVNLNRNQEPRVRLKLMVAGHFLAEALLGNPCRLSGVAH
jgi:hypothetical protein